jgi:hypothetical protein
MPNGWLHRAGDGARGRFFHPGAAKQNHIPYKVYRFYGFLSIS